ncbi:transmembrane protein 194A-like [Pyrus ussuriensis x Pyrus communis]|uniref:Transmembrane protein 194A-like n=1 Tax=Pyrus ussuriensis x Pyrus communis TaxID=2448454 RepID=A0A5N5HKE5_9ROSA|nr:transmembrane protein 194A-like [Pyrus ussuriensis x Pyrus communis]
MASANAQGLLQMRLFPSRMGYNYLMGCRNTSLEIGICPHSSRQKVPKGSWSRSMSPFEHQLIDVRTYGSSLESLEVSIEEEFVKYHVTFLILGIIMMSLVSLLSKSLVFYYGSGMANWGSPCNIDGTFSGNIGLKLLPTGRKNSLAIFVYSSVVGLGSFLLGYLPGLLRTLLTENGFSEDMYNPLAIFLLAFVFLAGAWLGFWAVCKLVLAEDGSIEIMTSQSVNWSIKILGTTVIFQFCRSPTGNRSYCSWIRSLRYTKEDFRWRFLHLVCKYLAFQFWSLVMAFQYVPTFPSLVSTGKSLKIPKKNHRRLEISDSPPSPPSQPSDTWLFPSTFHTTSERRKKQKFTEGWDAFTRETTEALQELAYSPEKVSDQPLHWWLLWLW